MTPPAVGNTSSPGRRPGRRTFFALGALTVLVVAAAVILGPGIDALTRGTPEEPESAVAQDSTNVPEQVIAYYFHTTRRCVSCRNIEKYTHEALESAFPAELESGDLVWRVINVEENGNEHFVDDYQLFTKSVVLVDARTGEWKNLPKVWQLLGDPNEFILYIQTETADFLQGQHS